MVGNHRTTKQETLLPRELRPKRSRRRRNMKSTHLKHEVNQLQEIADIFQHPEPSSHFISKRQTKLNRTITPTSCSTSGNCVMLGRFYPYPDSPYPYPLSQSHLHALYPQIQKKEIGLISLTSKEVCNTVSSFIRYSTHPVYRKSVARREGCYIDQRLSIYFNMQ